MATSLMGSRDLALVLAETAGDYLLGAVLTVAAALVVVAVMLATSRSKEDEDL